MASIIELKTGENPPKGRDWAMVVVHAPGVHAVDSMIRHDLGATFYSLAADAAVDRTIDKASAWADAHTVGTVYVRREAD
jgi:dTDP-D-glucose 4,6-dehydratase